MPLLMGPVLSFRGCDDNNWRLTAVVVAKADPGPLTAGGRAIPVEVLWDTKSGTAYRYSFAFPMGPQPTTGSYSVAGETYEIAIPQIGQAPTMAYASCNGFSSSKLKNRVKDPNCLWKAMADKHGLSVAPTKDATWPKVDKPAPYHLLLLGGDQVYADSIFETDGPLQQWINKSWRVANSATPTDKLKADIEAFYFKLYTERWSQPEPKAMFARVPSIAMWDDHDLMDGWGSYTADRQDCPMFDAIWNAAAKAFVVFQQHLKDGERRPGAISRADPDWWQKPDKQATRQGAFSFAHSIGGIAILAIDMRSQRTEDTQVVGGKHWDEIYDWIDALIEPKAAKKTTHLLIMASIPVVYPDFHTVESLLGIFPGHQDLEDDLRDHWNSPPHRGERMRMVKHLIEVPKHGIRATLISGDVHVAALGVLQSLAQSTAGPETVVNQLISSGIVHPDPGAVVLLSLKYLFDGDDPIDPYTVGRMIEIPGSKAKFVGARNFLSLEPDLPQTLRPGEPPRIWCNWMVENLDFVYTKVIEPLPPLQP